MSARATPVRARASCLVVAAGALVATLAGPRATLAAPAEIKVFTDEIAAPGHWTVETHANHARAPRAATGARDTAQLMPELSYGVAPGWELSLQLPFAREDARWSGRGLRTELQYVAPHDPTSGRYWGFNLELAEGRSGDGTRARRAEALLIVGWRAADWHWVANPALGVERNGGQREREAGGAFKVAHRISGAHWLGSELYLGRGRAPGTSAAGDARAFPGTVPGTPDLDHRALYLVLDTQLGAAEINVGIGRGLNAASDRRVIKLIVEWPLH